MALHVLLIEDEAHIVEAIRFLLSRDGWTVASHGEGTAAVAAIAAERPDVVILDAMLPGRSGYDVPRDLRADPATVALPVLMLTARGQDSDRRAAEAAGASGFMANPFSHAEMIAALRALLPAAAAPSRHIGAKG